MNYKDEMTIRISNDTEKIVSTLPDFARKYFDYIENLELSPLTRKQYAYDMKMFFTYLENSAGFKDVDMNILTAADVLDNLTLDDINEYLKSMRTYTVTDKNGNQVEKLYSPAIRARRMSTLRSFYKHYYEIGEINNNLSTLIPVPKIPEKVINVLERDQVTRILDAVFDTEGMSEGEIKKNEKVRVRDYAILMLFFGTGIRVSELVGINAEDVDFYNCSIKVTRKGRDEDTVFFGSEVEDALTEYMERSRPLLSGGEDIDALFLSNRKKRMEVRTVEIMIKNYAKKAGLNVKVTPHTLRRTYGTNLYEETGDIYLVADALAHSSVNTTVKHYAKMSEDHKRIAAMQSSSLFSERNKGK